MFLHVPLLPEQVAAGEPAALRHPACPGLPLATSLAAVEFILAEAAALEHAA
jgi:pyrrolidone-carboxylate peptidase